MELKSRRSEVDEAHAYIWVGCDNDVISSVAANLRRTETCWGN